MTEEKGTQTEPDRDTLWSILAYVPILCLIPLLQDNGSIDLKRHARQGIVLMLLEIVICILLIPGVTDLLLWVGLFICLLFAVIGAVNAAQGNYWRIPIISDIAEGHGLGKKES